MEINQLRTVTVQAKTVGFDKAKGDADQLTASQEDLAKSSLSVADGAARVQRQLQLQASMQATFTQSLSDQVAAIQAAQFANDNAAGASLHMADALRIGTKAAIDHAASWLATAGAVGAGALVLGGLLAVLGPIIIAYKLIKEAINLATEAWQLSGQELERYRQIGEKAAAVDLSTSYFQKIVKGAEDAKVPVDQLTLAFQNLQKSSADQLGGSALQQRLTQHTDAGNFSGNAGVSELAQANTLQETYKAITDLIRQAMQDGQRLAAIDIANTAFGPQAADNLRKDSEYFDKINASAAKVADTQIVSDADIGRALEMQNRWDEAVKIFETRWHPVQDVLTQGGIRLREVWVDIVFNIAQAVDQVINYVSELGKVPAWAQNKLNQAGTSIVNATTTPESRAAAEKSYGISSDPADIAATKAAIDYSAAVDLLAARLKNKNAVSAAGVQVDAIQNAIWADSSHTLDQQKNKIDDANDSVDRAINTLTRHIEQQNADAAAIGLGDGALAKFRAQAAETAAVQANGGKETAEQAAQFAVLKQRAFDAADGLAKMKVAGQIDFAQKTAFLSPEDVQIAQQLKGIYGNDIPAALTSTEAATLRAQNAMKGLNDAATQFGVSIVQAFASGKTGLDALLPSLTALGNQLTQIGAKNAIGGIEGILKGLGTSGFDPVSLGLGAAGIGISLISSFMAANQQQEAAMKQAKADWQKLCGEVAEFNTEAAAPAAVAKASANDNQAKEKRRDGHKHLSAA